MNKKKNNGNKHFLTENTEFVLLKKLVLFSAYYVAENGGLRPLPYLFSKLLFQKESLKKFSTLSPFLATQFTNDRKNWQILSIFQYPLPQIYHLTYTIEFFFQISVHEMKNFSKCLKKLIYLETLEVTKSNLDQHEKIFHLLSSIKNLPCLKVLTLTHCNISSKESGMYFEKYLSNNSTFFLGNRKFQKTS